MRVTATPARHGPEGIEPIAGPVTGFVLTLGGESKDAIYVSGDTVWYVGVAEVARRYSVRVVILFVGAARADAISPAHLTMTAEESVTAARAFPHAVIVPAHFEGWAHFSEGRAEVEKAFADAGLTDRLRWLTPGESTVLHQR